MIRRAQIGGSVGLPTQKLLPRQSPPQSPLEGRRCNHTLPSPLISKGMTQLRTGSVLRGLEKGKRVGSPSTLAAQWSPRGHSRQEGLLRVHRVAPRTIIACV